MTEKGHRPVVAIGSARAERGQRAEGWLDLGYRPDSSPIRTPVILVNGAGDGPALWIQAGIHGDEYDGTVAIWRALEHVDPATLRGTLILFPAINSSAYESSSRVSPI